MFTDVSGFTAMSERLDPEEVHAIMDRAFEVIMNAVHRYEGTINQFLGDGVMALFGAPIAHEDHASRALSAALTISRDLRPLGEEVKRLHGRDFLMRIGINTGPVVVGAIGRDLRMDYTAVGDTTNLAARLLNIAKPGQIVVSRYTQHLRDGFFLFEDLGEFEVKGKTHPVRAYALTGESRGRTRLEVSKDRGLTPLIGREAELARLHAAQRRAVGGQGLVLLVTGEPGQGKSRLLYEFLQGLEAVEVIEASCLSYGAAMPYHPILEALRRYLGLTEGMADDEIRQRLANGLASLGLDEANAVDVLGHFIGISAAPGFLGRLQAAQLKEQTLGLLRMIFLKASEHRPIVLIVENVHWIDASSAEFLRSLAGALPLQRVLLVLTARPGLAASAVPPVAETIALGGLDDHERRRMVLALLGARSTSDDLFQTVLAKAEGNPLYVEEIVRQLRESGGLVVEDGHATLRTANLKVPATIHDIIAARVDRLAERLKATLQPAAVIGRQFAVPVLAGVLGTNGELVGRLDDLYALDLVFPSDSVPDLSYSFKHALTQDVVYDSLLVRKRRQYHGAVGAVIEERFADRLQEFVELLAYHFAHSENVEKAVDYGIRAGEKAQRRWANPEALAHFEAAVASLESLPDTEPNRLRRIDAIVKQAEVKFALGRHAEHIAALEGIRDLVETIEDPPRQAAWYGWAGFLHSLTGSPPEVPISYCRRALEIAEASRLEEYSAFAQCSLTHVSVVAGDLRGAVEAGTRALPLFERQGNLWWASRTLWGLSMAFNAIGEWRHSMECCRKGLEYGQTMSDLRLKVVGLFRTGSTHILRGDPQAGLRYCEEALALSSPVPFDTAMIKAVRALGLAKAGDAAAGIADMREAVAWFERSKLRYTRSVVALWLAETYLRQGDRAEARALIDDVLATSREIGYRYLAGVAVRLLGESLVATEPEAARGHLDAARQMLEDVDARNDLAKTLVARATLHRAMGEPGAARQLFEEALAMFEALGTVDETARVRAMLEVTQPAAEG
jgi:class 3 adenylate cyclase/tetratricopeptide (TPR) repeat protein